MTTSPLLARGPFVTDGGLETDLIFHHGADLPEFAAFPLVEDEGGRALLRELLRRVRRRRPQGGQGPAARDARPGGPTRTGRPRSATTSPALDRVNQAAVEFIGVQATTYADLDHGAARRRDRPAR